MKNEIVKIKASDYGLEESKASEIEALFVPMLTKMKELESEYNNILALEINPETCQQAKDLRQSYVKIRTGTAEIHKKAKQFYLNGGRFVDGWKNAQIFASGEKEDNLRDIEKHFERMEAKKKENLRDDRMKVLNAYTEIEPLGLGDMSEDVWNSYLLGQKTAYEAKIAAEKKAEEERIAAEKAEADRIEAQRLDNIRLAKEVKIREAQIEKERKERADYQAKKDAELLKERQKAKVLQDQKDAADKARQAKVKADQEAARKLKLAPDKDKLLAFCQSLNDVERPEIKSIEAAAIMAQVNGMLIRLNEYIIANTEKL